MGSPGMGRWSRLGTGRTKAARRRLARASPNLATPRAGLRLVKLALVGLMHASGLRDSWSCDTYFVFGHMALGRDLSFESSLAIVLVVTSVARRLACAALGRVTRTM